MDTEKAIESVWTVEYEYDYGQWQTSYDWGVFLSREDAEAAIERHNDSRQARLDAAQKLEDEKFEKAQARHREKVAAYNQAVKQGVDKSILYPPSPPMRFRARVNDDPFRIDDEYNINIPEGYELILRKKADTV